MPRTQNPKAKYWMLTIPSHLFLPYLPPTVDYVGGQLEEGSNTGYTHWQLIAVFSQQVRLTRVKDVFGHQVHAEATRSASARDYVFKEDTSIPGTKFELGTYPFRRNQKTDWNKVKLAAQKGNLDCEDIPSQVYIQNYRTLKEIRKDHLVPEEMVRKVYVYYGETETGKSKTAFANAGRLAYPKDPNTKYWDGYQQQEHVVIDEFRGLINISNMLRWLDRYPVIVEAKHGATVLCATTIWITSNLHPRDWYPDLDEQTKDALLRRLDITHFVK